MCFSKHVILWKQITRGGEGPTDFIKPFFLLHEISFFLNDGFFYQIIWSSPSSSSPHHHQACLRHLVCCWLHSLVVALPGAGYLQGEFNITSSAMIMVVVSKSSKSLTISQLIKVCRLVASKLTEGVSNWQGRESPRSADSASFLICLITFTVNLLSSSSSEVSILAFLLR